MSLALKWGDADSDQFAFIYFDAVTSYKTQYKGKVTEHPIDGGATISDHFVKHNPKVAISGVITGADITFGNENIQDEEGNSPVNTKQAPGEVFIDAGSSSVNSLLPASISQLFSPQEPSIILDSPQDKDVVEQVKMLMSDLISGEKFNEISKTFTNNMQLLQLYEYRGTVIRSIVDNFVMIGLDFNEDADSGDALYCEVVLERIGFSFGRSESLPPDLAADLTNKGSPVENKGKQDSTITDIGEVDEPTALKKLLLKSSGL